MVDGNYMHRLLQTGRAAMIATFASLASISATAPADALGNTGIYEMEFISETRIAGASGQFLALCHLIGQNGAWGYPLVSVSKDYVLAENNCVARSYNSILTADLIRAQKMGAIPADIPLSPSLGTKRNLHNFLFLTCLGLLSTHGILNVLRTRRRRRPAKGCPRAEGAAFSATIDAMCHVARADGQVSDKIPVISYASSQLLGKPIGDQKISRMLKSTAPDLPASEFTKFAQGLNEDECRTVMRAVLMVAACDGQIAAPEQAFIGRLAKATRISLEDVGSMLGELSAGAKPA